jgi:hypothetical protein
MRIDVLSLLMLAAAAAPAAKLEVVVPSNAPDHLRIAIPEGADPETIRVTDSGTGKVLPHWTQWIEMSRPVDVASSAGIHYGFPRMVRTRSNDLLLFYRTGTTHANDPAFIAMRRSSDNGLTWSAERIVERDPDPNHSTHNPVALVAPSGRIMLWVSSWGYRASPATADKGYWSWSEDDGHTWAPFTIFDRDPSRSIYYFTEGVVTSGGMLISGDTFPAGGLGNAHSLLWHTSDGIQWKPWANLTDPALNVGDEVAINETEPGVLLCIQRARRPCSRPSCSGASATPSESDRATYRMWSRDGGKTWSERENLYPMLRTTLQRPFLTRLDERTLLLSGRDYERRLVCVFVSTDNGKTFSRKHVIDHFNGDGGYTTAVPVGRNRVLMAYYSDSNNSEWQPAIRLVYLSLRTRPEYLWVNLEPDAPRSNLLVDFDAKEPERRDRAHIDSGVHFHTAQTRKAK